MKKAYLLALLPAAFVLSGCDEGEQNAELCSYYVQQDLDAQNFESAIDRLSQSSCQNAYPDGEYNIDLGMAYLGKAGTSMTDIMAAMLDEEDSDGGDSDGFGGFISALAGNQNDSALSDLAKAKEAFNQYTNVQANLDDGTACTVSDTVESSDIGGVCMISGFVDVVKTTTAFDVIAGGQIDAWLENEAEEGKDDGTLTTMDHSACALDYAVKKEIIDKVACTVDDVDINAVQTDIIFDENGDYEKEYTLVTLTSGTGVTENITYHLLTYVSDLDNYSTVFTTGYCDLTYSNISDTIGTNSPYPCPTTRKEEDLTVEDFIVDAFNNGIDSIVAVVNSSGLLDDEDMADESEIEDAVNDFKKEICELNRTGADACTPDALKAAPLNINDIIAFINDDSN